MAKFSYNTTAENQILMLIDRLAEGQWAKVPKLQKIELDSPLLATIKAAVLVDVEALAAALNGTFTGALPEDVAWDNEQTRYDLMLQLELRSDDAARVEAAEVLRRDTLMGRGTAQTKQTFEDEVAFGVRQRTLATQAPYAAHITLLGLTDQLKRIDDATRALDAGIKAGKAAGAASRSLRVKNALSSVRLTLQWAHRTLDQLAQKAHSKAERERVAELLAPFTEIGG